MGVDFIARALAAKGGNAYIPVFHLSDLGMSEHTIGGSPQECACDTTEILAAMRKGFVGFRIPTDYGIATVFGAILELEGSDEPQLTCAFYLNEIFGDVCVRVTADRVIVHSAIRSGSTGGDDTPDIPDTPEINPITFGTDGVARVNKYIDGQTANEVSYYLNKVDGASSIVVTESGPWDTTYDFSSDIANNGSGDYFVTCDVVNEDYQYIGSYTSNTVTFSGDISDDEDWLFHLAHIDYRGNGGLPAPAPNTAYSLFIDGKKVETAMSNGSGELNFQMGVYYTNADGGCWYANTDGYYSVAVGNEIEVDENWLFQNEPIDGSRYDLPAPELGVSYTCECSWGSATATSYEGENGVNLIFVIVDHPVDGLTVSYSGDGWYANNPTKDLRFSVRINESGTGDTGGGDTENWLFKDVGIYQLPDVHEEPVEGVSYTLFLNGVESETATAYNDGEGLVLYFYDGGIQYQWGSWGYGDIPETLISVRING